MSRNPLRSGSGYSRLADLWLGNLRLLSNAVKSQGIRGNWFKRRRGSILHRWSRPSHIKWQTERWVTRGRGFVAAAIAIQTGGEFVAPRAVIGWLLCCRSSRVIRDGGIQR
jgi:hypothetical protein